MSEPTAPDPHELIVAREERVALLKRALLAMTSRERTVLLKHEVGGERLGTIARAMHISISEASELLDRARRHMHTIANA
jgi:DNA-directed RNA polymerase specialized sigma24 family protein